MRLTFARLLLRILGRLRCILLRNIADDAVRRPGPMPRNRYMA